MPASAPARGSAFSRISSSRMRGASLLSTPFLSLPPFDPVFPSPFPLPSPEPPLALPPAPSPAMLYTLTHDSPSASASSSFACCSSSERLRRFLDSSSSSYCASHSFKASSPAAVRSDRACLSVSSFARPAAVKASSNSLRDMNRSAMERGSEPYSAIERGRSARKESSKHER